MKQPTAITYLIGSVPACAISVTLAGFIVYGWMSGAAAVSWLVPLVAVVIAVKAVRSRQEIQAFRNWQRNWNSVAGITEPKARSWRKKPWAPALWLGLLALAITQPYSDPNLAINTGTVAALSSAIQIALFLTTVWITGRLVWKSARWLVRRRPRASKATLHVVRVCLSVPVFSVRADAHLIASLPEYCRALLTTRSSL